VFYRLITTALGSGLGSWVHGGGDVFVHWDVMQSVWRTHIFFFAFFSLPRAGIICRYGCVSGSIRRGVMVMHYGLNVCTLCIVGIT
jgi:hypothetical protein